MDKKEPERIKILAFLIGLAAFMIASLHANGLMVPAQSLVMVVMAASAVFGVIAMSVGNGISNRLPVFLFLLVACYFFVRAICSPVRDLANEDLVLITIATLSFFVFAGLSGGGRWLLICLLVLTVVHVGTACLQKFELLATHHTGRVMGLFWHYNYFANFAAAGLMACLTVLLWGKVQIVVRFILVAISLITLITIFWSESRGAVLALGVSGVVFLVLSYMALPALPEALRRRYRLVLLLAFCAGVAGGGVLLYQVFSQKAEGATGGDILFASTLRLYFVPMAVEQFQDAPIFGTGSRTFSYLCFQYWNPNIAFDRPNPEYVHNDHIQTLAEYGLVGYLLVFSFVAYSVISGIKYIRKSRYGSESDSPLLIITGICLVVFACVHALVDFNLHLAPNLMVAVAGLVMIHCRPRSEGNRSGGSKSDWLWFYGIILMMTPAMVHASAFGLGELVAGRELAEANISRETSNWVPATAKLDIQKVALERAVDASPTFRRHAHLGLCYQFAAARSDDLEQRNDLLEMAINSYRASVERNPINPVAKLNLAKCLGDTGAWEESDQAFEEAMETAGVREPWLLGQLGWATMFSNRAVEAWRSGDIESAERYFKRAISLAEECKSMYRAHRDPKWLSGYTQINIYYARMLVAEKRLDDAGEIYSGLNTLAKREQTEPETRLVQNYADFLYRKAVHMWHTRKLDEAAGLLLLSEKEYLKHRRLVEGEVDLEWDIGYKELQKTIAFFRKTGLMGKQRSPE